MRTLFPARCCHTVVIPLSYPAPTVVADVVTATAVVTGNATERFPLVKTGLSHASPELEKLFYSSGSCQRTNVSCTVLHSFVYVGSTVHRA